MAALQQLTEATQHTDIQETPSGESRADQTHLVLIGGVEGDFGHFGVLFSHVPHGAAAQLNALQQGRF